MNILKSLKKSKPTTFFLDDESPLRSELFSAAQMEHHGQVLAGWHVSALQHLHQSLTADLLLPRLADNEQALRLACNALIEAIQDNKQITPAAEWLLDNFYLIEEQIRTAKQHLPKGYSKGLPRLTKGASAGKPRVYDIALEITSHGDGRVDPDSLSQFIAAYQQVTTLTLGELWAIPIMLRLALIENLRRVAMRIAVRRVNRNLASYWADQMIEATETNPSSLILLVADMARSLPELNNAFVAELARCLQGQSPALMLPLTWVAQRLTESALTIENLVQLETQQQAAEQVTISNSIGSLRFLGSMDWREFVEAMSHVEHLLRQDAAAIYSKMDFATRDTYRHAVEKLAKHTTFEQAPNNPYIKSRFTYTEASLTSTPSAEVLVAKQAQLLSQCAASVYGREERTAHIGYYLVGNGLPLLENALNIEHSLLARALRYYKRQPLRLYLGTILLLMGIFSGTLLHILDGNGLATNLLVWVVILTIFSSSQLASDLVNWIVTLFAKPRPLPRLDFSKGIPASARTLVVVPTLLTDAQSIAHLCESIEVSYLANRDDNLRFCLLTDFADAQSESMPNDAALIHQASQAIKQLNEKYIAYDSSSSSTANTIFSLFAGASYKATPFLLLHRPRRYNAQEHCWMGFERKRGKLADLNTLLRLDHYAGESQLDFTSLFSNIVGDTDELPSVKYVITLDTDTQLPRDAAKRFIATMAHPLNQPLFDKQKRRVIEGYGILQPRVVASLPSKNASIYEKLCGGEVGIDPYTRSVSDVYQDLFAEGSFIGKGIYDVDAFEQALKGQFPNNRILSHDLLEGCYVRSGLMSDSQLYEAHPALYSADVSRRHRWIRGDWQLFAWLFPMVPTGLITNNGLHKTTASQLQTNTLSSLSRWKILDNLRRSLIAPVLFGLLLLGWLLLPATWIWSCAVIVIIFLPTTVAALFGLCNKSDSALLRQHFKMNLHAAQQGFNRALLDLIFLPYQAFYSLHAILITLWRMLFSHRLMLQWRPSSDFKNQADTGFFAAYRTMWFAPFIAISVMVALIAVRPMVLIIAMPMLFLWLASPAIAWWISCPILPKQEKLHDKQCVFLNKLARQTWHFFETYVTAEDNWLPPDNMQLQPVAALAHRTSPTNIGLALLANLTAYDFGYISTANLLQRTTNTMQTLGAMERYQGHFYNWYNTQTLQPLQPMYVSTVDSGNLAGHLLTLRTGLLLIPNEPIVSPRLFIQLRDNFDVLLSVLQLEHLPFFNAQEVTLPNDVLTEFIAIKQKLDDLSQFQPTSLISIMQNLDLLAMKLQKLTQHIALNIGPDAEAHWWIATLKTQCMEACNELLDIAPWLNLANQNLFNFSEICSHLDVLNQNLNLSTLAQSIAHCQGSVAQLSGSNSAASLNLHYLAELNQLLVFGATRVRERLITIEHLAAQAVDFSNMEYAFLYDTTTHLLAIGYNVNERKRDAGFYDLLASEARLCSFVAIAQGQLPQETWFALGRQLTIADGEPILLSWSGSMFEYLMPLLVMPNYENTLIDQTYHSVVQRQINYGNERNVPWGFSESGYYAFDANLNYQYRAFGVPGLGLKRGLGDDLVVAPYATVLALMVMPEAAYANLQRLAKLGLEGKFGFYEAIDYSPLRLPRGQSQAIISSYMAHHQGMSLLALAYVLLDKPMQRRFESFPLFQATLLLLKERIPKPNAFYANTSELADIRSDTSDQAIPMRTFSHANTRIAEVQLLSNGRYHVMMSADGGSASRWRDLSLTRWREDSTCDKWGTFCYVRDLADASVWSTTYQPTLTTGTNYEVIFTEGRAEFRRQDNGLEMHTEVVVSPEDDIELRRTRITNRSRTTRIIDITSYAEVVLAPAAADAAHPAFSNLFVQTELLTEKNAILCTRRPRSASEHSPAMLHVMAIHGATTELTSYETDRMKFIGRGNSLASPSAMTLPVLSNSAGSVLDPIVAIRRKITLAPDQMVVIDMVLGAADTREAALGLIDKYQDLHLTDRVLGLAWTHSQVVLRQLNASEADAQLYGRLANTIIYGNALLRADASILVQNRRGQSGLWSYAISGDLPIALLRIGSIENIELVRQIIQAHAYWRMKGLAVDLVIWNEDTAGYRQVLQEQIIGLVASASEPNNQERPGGVFIRHADQIASEDRILLQTVARAILSDTRGTLAEQINRRNHASMRVPQLIATVSRDISTHDSDETIAQELLMFNGIGGFSTDGQEYVITSSASNKTPAPWVNVIANAQFGTVISESGQAYTWGENAHEFRLTPWSNDPVSDSGGEVFYLRDEETGEFWSPTALPQLGKSSTSQSNANQTSYTTRHGFGYSVFEHTHHAIQSSLTVYVAQDASVKFSVLKVSNHSGGNRQLSATAYVEWVLGDLRQKNAMHIITEADPATGALIAKNPYNIEFTGRTAFLYVDAMNLTMTGDRTEFIGRNGSLSDPAAMYRTRLSGKLGAGLDPCAAIQVPFELADGEEKEIVFLLGVADKSHTDVSMLVQRFRGTLASNTALMAVKHYWQQTLGAVKVDTPDPALNLLANGWLMYQTIACRLWARSGFYQSGGAFGFRDQLQDVMALIYTQPHLMREHLLLAAAHQFKEGDAQHWWHPPSNRGVRTHCSDDYLWLALATCRYVTSTHDTGVLDETIVFLEGRALNPSEDSYYDLPNHSNEYDTLYEHCKRAISHGLAFGVHGLPLIGSCDWNDGMDKVGSEGKGESVWLAFFLYEVLNKFVPIAQIKGDEAFITLCQQQAIQLQKNIEQSAWDGEWYRRAYFDDGTPLGSSINTECKIDSISQSWSVLSAAGSSQRTQTAMHALDQYLVKREAGLVQLLDPPFDQSTQNPGYIRGYVPGVRENGGQYTHAAVWAAMAFAKMGDAEKAWELFNMINPIHHGNTADAIATYKVEPYVVAADVYGVAPHIGRGGWTWYTGSSGWMYRLIMESLLGITLQGNELSFTPCLPARWKSFKLDYHYRNTRYQITVYQQVGMEGNETISAFNIKPKITIDNIKQNHTFISLVDDEINHEVTITFDTVNN